MSHLSYVIMAACPPRHCSQSSPVIFASPGLLQNEYQNELQNRLFMENVARKIDGALLRFDYSKLRNSAALAICCFLGGAWNSLK